jgi:hypothetical protein
MKTDSSITRRRLLRDACALAATVPVARALVACGAEEPTPQARTGAGAVPGAGRDEREAPPAGQAPAAPQAPAGQAQAQAAQPQAPAGQPPAAPPQAQAQPAQPPAPGGGEGRLVTEIPEMQPLVQSLQYTNQSPKPDQHCANCLFYTAASEDRGHCQLFSQNLVMAQGWCASWQQKIPPPS